jgi:hypothetical protein
MYTAQYEVKTKILKFLARSRAHLDFNIVSVAGHSTHPMAVRGGFDGANIVHSLMKFLH